MQIKIVIFSIFLSFSELVEAKSSRLINLLLLVDKHEKKQLESFHEKENRSFNQFKEEKKTYSQLHLDFQTHQLALLEQAQEVIKQQKIELSRIKILENKVRVLKELKLRNHESLRKQETSVIKEKENKEKNIFFERKQRILTQLKKIENNFEVSKKG